MERRALVAIFLSMLVLLVWGYYEQKNIKGKQVLQKQLAVEAEKKSAPTVKPEEMKPPIVTGQKPLPLELLAETPSYMGGKPAPVKDIVVESDLATITFTTLGGRLKSYLLKDYRGRDGKRLQMIPELGYKELPLALDFRQEGGKLVTAGGQEFDATLFDTRLNTAAYEAGVDRLVLDSSHPNAKLSLSYHDASGVKVVKEFTFYRDKYTFQADVRVEGLAPYPRGVPYDLLWGPAIRGDKKRKGQEEDLQVTSYDGKEVKKQKPKKLKDDLVVTGPIKWVAIGTKYFVVAMLPGDTPSPAVLQRADDKKIAIGIELRASNGAAASLPELYVGPKERKRLESYGVSLQKVIDYGWTPFGDTVTGGLAKLLMALLIWFYSFTKNYGLAIILLTVLIKFAFYPLTEKSFVAMQRMQVLQPKIKALQARYKNDRQRLNQELMQLYRTHKANPMGGCLPMLAQLPIFYALYVVLMYSIELRQAPFIFWIKDLADYDPYFITPILMGVTMFFQQKMSPTVGDPAQAKMMLMMPVIFTVMFIYFPVGLVIYWMVNNLLTIAQQYFIKKRMAAAPEKK